MSIYYDIIFFTFYKSIDDIFRSSPWFTMIFFPYIDNTNTRSSYFTSSPNLFEYFTCRFEELNQSDLCYYLPELTPQGYAVLPRLIGHFKRESQLLPTLANFDRWLRRVTLPDSIADQRTINALSRRLAQTVEARIFDGLDLHDISLKELTPTGTCCFS